jgi:3-isopropylmalate dehydratase small subunit
MKIIGNAHKFGDNVDTDVIIPARYLVMPLAEQAKHAMEPIDAAFAKRVKHGDVIAAGKNFGCGSSREQAPLVLKHLGISAVIAKSFARIFYRNAIGIGLPVLESDAPGAIKDGEKVEIDVGRGEITASGRRYKCTALPQFLQEIINDGGLIAHLKKG